uniref:Uncharacterized protein n=1 Tax=Arundo donax TaxID=35708 RepID=A0A0A8XWP4_ARUDO
MQKFTLGPGACPQSLTFLGSCKCSAHIAKQEADDANSPWHQRYQATKNDSVARPTRIWEDHVATCIGWKAWYRS